MVTIIGVRFRTAGKIYYFDPGELQITANEKVVVETSRGVELGDVVLGRSQIADEKITQPLKPVLRVATEEDLEKEAKNREKEKEAFRICQEKISRHELEMKLIGCEYTLDNNKLLFYFTADGRVDFRELVKDLAGVFKTRIELRQVGVRDETKMRGGIGICGRPLCCATYLSDFAPVSIKMAKEQNLSLNPTKISGVCGRLMCCLTNEEETYEYLNSKLPNMGDIVTTPEGLKGQVTGLNVLRQKVKVTVELDEDSRELREYVPEELKFKPRRKKDKSEQDSSGELNEQELNEQELAEAFPDEAEFSGEIRIQKETEEIRAEAEGFPEPEEPADAGDPVEPEDASSVQKEEEYEAMEEALREKDAPKQTHRRGSHHKRNHKKVRPADGTDRDASEKTRRESEDEGGAQHKQSGQGQKKQNRDHDNPAKGENRQKNRAEHKQDGHQEQKEHRQTGETKPHNNRNRRHGRNRGHGPEGALGVHAGGVKQHE